MPGKSSGFEMKDHGIWKKLHATYIPLQRDGKGGRTRFQGYDEMRAACESKFAFVSEMRALSFASGLSEALLGALNPGGSTLEIFNVGAGHIRTPKVTARL